MVGPGIYENQIGPFSYGELTDALEHVFKDASGEPIDLQGESYTCTGYALKPDGTVAEYEGSVLSGGRAAVLMRPLDQLGVWRVQLWVTNEGSNPDADDLRNLASWHFVFEVQPSVLPAA